MGAAGSALWPLLSCGSATGRLEGPTRADRADPEALREQLRALVDELERRYPAAHGSIQLRTRGGAAADASERGVNLETTGAAVFAAFDGKRWLEQATSDLSTDGLSAATRSLTSRAGAGPGGRPTRREVIDRRTDLRIDPLTVPVERWLAGVDALAARTLDLGGSRIVYRGSYLTVDELRTLFVGGGRDLFQRIVRTRAGVVFVAVTGSTPSADEASYSGTTGLEVLDLPDAALAEGAERALALLTARPAPSGDGEVVLDPSLTSLLAQRCIGPAFEGDRWASRESRAAALTGSRIAADTVTVIDDPAAAGGYGSYFFDDEGTDARAVTLIEAGIAREPLLGQASARALKRASNGHARRPSPLEPAATAASNLRVSAGKLPVADLIASVSRGLLVEGGLAAHCDPGTLRFALRASRAREIVAGRLTGRLYAEVDVIGDLPSLLGAVRGASAMSSSIASDHGLPSSATAPAIATTARVARGG